MSSCHAYDKNRREDQRNSWFLFHTYARRICQVYFNDRSNFVMWKWCGVWIRFPRRKGKVVKKWFFRCNGSNMLVLISTKIKPRYLVLLSIRTPKMINQNGDKDVNIGSSHDPTTTKIESPINNKFHLFHPSLSLFLASMCIDRIDHNSY